MEIKRLGLSATRNFDKGGADESRPFFSATRHLRLARRAACSLLSETPATTSTWIGDPAPRMAPLCHFPTTNGLYPLSWPGRRFRASPSFSLVTCTLVRRPFFGSGVGVLGPHQWGVDHHRQAISVRRANAYSAYLSFRIQKTISIRESVAARGPCRGSRDAVHVPPPGGGEFSARSGECI